MRDVIVIGDVHGDGDRLIHALQRLQLGGEDATWRGGGTGVVMLGDVLDGRERGTGEYLSKVGDVDTVRYIEALRASAARSQRGGSVTCLLGNHELMNRGGMFDYVHRADLERYGREVKRYQMMSSRGEVGRVLATWKRSHIDNNTLFCHAGVHTDAADSVRDREDVAAGLPSVSDFHLTEHRQYMTDSFTSEQSTKLRRMLARCRCRQMMIGHNSVPEITPMWGGAVVLADACLSRAYGSSAAMHVACVRPGGEWDAIDIRLR